MQDSTFCPNMCFALILKGCPRTCNACLIKYLCSFSEDEDFSILLKALEGKGLRLTVNIRNL